MERIRLDKYLASQNNLSRKDVKAIIRQGRVQINQDVAARAEQRVTPEQDRVMLDGETVIYKRNLYLMMNKPNGVVSASRDLTERTVVDLLPDDLKRKGLFPAGRLDKDTEGLLVITDDGDFAHRLLSPKNKVPKIYQAVLSKKIGAYEISAFGIGVRLADGTVCLPADLCVLEEGEHPVVQVKIFEGKYHQVKRMFLALGARVLALKRVQIGRLPLDTGLSPGECRELSKNELVLIQSAEG